jgi:hypothetical protein
MNFAMSKPLLCSLATWPQSPSCRSRWVGCTACQLRCRWWSGTCWGPRALTQGSWGQFNESVSAVIYEQELFSKMFVKMICLASNIARKMFVGSVWTICMYFPRFHASQQNYPKTFAEIDNHQIMLHFEVQYIGRCMWVGSRIVEKNCENVELWVMTIWI